MLACACDLRFFLRLLVKILISVLFLAAPQKSSRGMEEASMQLIDGYDNYLQLR
jgi:hypothetical protein